MRHRDRIDDLVGLMALAALGVVVSRLVRSANPCSSVSGDPGPPPVNPKPTIGGTVTNANTHAGISGATMELYRCDDGSGVLEDSTTTDASGDYEFADLEQNWYYVEAVMTGPLSGLSPASGTSNPSDVIEVGNGDSEVDFAFE